ncbi:MAG: M3 family metallopeptidase [Acidobacteriota bacterium]
MRFVRSFVLSLAILSQIKAADVALPFWSVPQTVESFQREAGEWLNHARELRAQMLAVSGPRTRENTLVPFDEIQRYGDLAAQSANLLQNTHPDAAMRQAAQSMVQAVSAFQTEVQLDPHTYQALASIAPPKDLDPEESYYLEKTLKALRDAGVDKPEAVRKQIGDLRAQIVKLQQQFDRNIVDGLKEVPYRPEQLAGLPEDVLRGRKRDSNGDILISNDRADAEPVGQYASNAEVRRAVSLATANRGFPANMAVLDQLIAARHRLATLAGYKNFAEMAAATRMVESEANHRAFLTEVERATKQAAQEEQAILLAAKRRSQPGAAMLNSWDVAYYSRLVRGERFAFDDSEARPYFSYVRVQQGVFDAASKLFDVTFRAANVPTWHPSVEPYDVLRNGEVIARVYLDMFPRPDKYQHFASSTVRAGLNGRQLPEGVLMCNFTAPTTSDPGLMTPNLARTYFHEFGHLMHTVMAGRQKWAGLGRPEGDFMEAPSQLLEEWFRNPKVLAGFARHYKTGEPIPTELVERMERADHFGEALGTRQQLALATMSLYYHDGREKVDTDLIARDIALQYGLPVAPDDFHRQTSFTHLGTANYAASYYTYQWSLVIAKDLFSQFRQEDLFDPAVAQKYREAVLAPGGSLPAARLVENFLGRPFNLQAYQTWLQQK